MFLAHDKSLRHSQLISDVFQDENDVAEQLVGFLQQFLSVFSELQGKNLYLTGESVSPR